MRSLVAGGYRVVNYDARGHGESDWSPTGDYGFATLADDLHAIADALPGAGPIGLVGASMGGLTSFHMMGTRRHPRVRALVMVDIALSFSADGVEKIQQFMTAHHAGFKDLEEASDAVAAYNPHRPRPSDPSGLRKNLRLGEDGRLYWHWDPRMFAPSQRPRPETLSQELAALSDRITVPTLLVHGTKSDIVDAAGIAELRRLVPQTEVYDVAGAGHMVAGDRNDAFSIGVIQFLDRHLAPQ